MIIFSVLLSVICGVCMAFQSPTNATLSGYIGNFAASTVSFGGGVLLLIIATLTVGDGNILMATHAEPWQLISGLYGAYGVLIITFAAPVLGIALTLTITMLGQIVMGTMVDTFGWFAVEPSPLSALRIVGAAFVAAGIVLVYVGKKKQASGGNRTSNWLILSLLTFIAGVAGAAQAPTNTSLSLYTGKVEASLISFLGGFIVLLIVTLIKGRGRFPAIPRADIKPWMVIGGAYGAFVVFAMTVATPYIGVALVMASSMLGQLTSAIVIDSKGLLRANKIGMNRERYLGVAAIGAGVILVTMARLGIM